MFRIFKIKNKKANVIIAGVLTAAVVFGVMVPIIQEIRKITLDTYEERVALESLYLRGQNLKRARKYYDEIKSNIHILDNAYNYYGQELNFITSLENVANAEGVKQIIDIKNNNKDVKKLYGVYEPIRVNLKLTGTFSEILNYLDKINALDYYYNIDSLTLHYPQAELFKTGPGAKNENKIFEKKINSPQINAEISGLTYWK